MEKKLGILEQIFGLIEKVTGFLEKYGIFKLFKTVFAVIVLYWLIIVSFNPHKIFEAWDKYQERVHKEKVNETYEKQYAIKNNVLDLHYQTNALRTLVLTLHNGAESLNGSYQFLKLSALFEECGDNPSVMDDYQNIHLTQFPIFSFLAENETFCGTLEELKEVDSKLYYRLVANDVAYVHIQSLIGERGDIIGFIVMTWKENHNDHKHIHSHIYKKAIAISRLME